MTVTQGTFAIKIKDWTKFSAFRNSKDWRNYDKGARGELKKLRDKYDGLDSNGNFNKMTNALLEILRDADTGIGLFEASPNLSSWSELTLSPLSATSPTTEPIKNPCN